MTDYAPPALGETVTAAMGFEKGCDLSVATLISEALEGRSTKVEFADVMGRGRVPRGRLSNLFRSRERIAPVSV